MKNNEQSKDGVRGKDSYLARSEKYQKLRNLDVKYKTYYKN